MTGFLDNSKGPLLAKMHSTPHTNAPAGSPSRTRSAGLLLSIDEAEILHAREQAKEFLRERLWRTFTAMAQREAPPKPCPAWLLRWVTPDFLFAALHWWALITLLYGMSWTLVAVSTGELPLGKLWKPMKLLKLSYPMLPVILGSWICRSKFNNGSYMSSGYYFSNLKMGLLPSLGPGMIIGVILDKLVVRPQFEPFHVQEEFRKIMLPTAWLSGFFIWIVIQLWIPPNEETRRKDWGLYSRWYLEPHSGFGHMRKLNPFSEWVHKGPHFFLYIIPTPKHGTFHKVLQANKARSIGITVCSIVMWFLLLVWWSVLSGDAWRKWWTSLMSDHVKQLIIDTDFPNLFFNTLTAPYLIYDTWRKEPSAQTSSDLQNVYDSAWADVGPKSRPIIQPGLPQESNEEIEMNWIFEELIQEVMKLPLEDIMKLKELRDIVDFGCKGDAEECQTKTQHSRNANIV